MIKKLKVTNYRNESIELDLSNPERSGLYVINIDGIGPPEADVNTVRLASDDGSTYNSATMHERNITITLGMLFAPTIEDSRLLTYKYFPVKRPISLTFYTDNKTVKIQGYVEHNKPIIFSKTETTQISIICPNPYFQTVSSKNTIFSGVDDMFEFPFSNESLTDSLITFSMLRLQQEETVYYEGEYETGIVIRIHVLALMKNLTIYNIDTRAKFSIDSNMVEKHTGSHFTHGDDILISTVKGNKRVMLTRAGKVYNILNCLDRHSDWLTILPGDNIFVYTAEVGERNLQFKIEHATLFEGV